MDNFYVIRSGFFFQVLRSSFFSYFNLHLDTQPWYWQHCRDKGQKPGFHGRYVRWQLRNRCTRMEQSLLSYLFMAQIKSSQKSDLFISEITSFLHTCALCSQLPSSISTMLDSMNLQLKKKKGELWRARICIREGRRKDKVGYLYQMVAQNTVRTYGVNQVFRFVEYTWSH